MIPHPIFIILLSVFGLLIGSFLNVLILRLPHEQRISGRSKCPQCKHELSWYELVPVLSWLIQKGKCRSCHHPISIRYPVIEVATAALFALVACQILPASYTDVAILAKTLFVCAVCLIVFVVDFEHYLILDRVVFPASIVLLILNLFTDLLSHQSPWPWGSFTVAGLLGAAVAGSLFWIIWRMSNGRWMGYGDVKYVLFMGLALSFPVIIIGLFLAFMIGAFVSVFLLLFGRKQMTDRVPFGTFLTIATVIAMLWGPTLWSWYANLTGLN